MSKRNKKKQADGYFFPKPLAVVLALVAVFALCNLCLTGRSDAVGREIKALEGRRNVLRERLKKEESEWSLVRSPVSVENALREQGLVMSWPRRDQIVRLSRPSAFAAAPVNELAKPPRPESAQKVVMND